VFSIAEGKIRHTTSSPVNAYFEYMFFQSVAAVLSIKYLHFPFASMSIQSLSLCLSMCLSVYTSMSVCMQNKSFYINVVSAQNIRIYTCILCIPKKSKSTRLCPLVVGNPSHGLGLPGHSFQRCTSSSKTA